VLAYLGEGADVVWLRLIFEAVPASLLVAALAKIIQSLRPRHPVPSNPNHLHAAHRPTLVTHSSGYRSPDTPTGDNNAGNQTYKIEFRARVVWAVVLVALTWVLTPLAINAVWDYVAGEPTFWDRLDTLFFGDPRHARGQLIRFLQFAWCFIALIAVLSGSEEGSSDSKNED
jgi:hypothetical protein